MSGHVFASEPQNVPAVDTKYRRTATPPPVPESLQVPGRIRTYEPRSTQGQAPVVWVRAEGFEVYDPYGNMWLDWSSGVLVANSGHGHPAILEAVRSETERGLLFSYCFPTEARSSAVTSRC